MNDTLTRFGADYARCRASEGRGHAGDELLSLPYLKSGPLARQWAVRARSYEAFRAHVLRPHAARLGRPLRVLDLGAGNAWLSYRVALDGHDAIALDIRDDDVDGLGAAGPFLRRAQGKIELIQGSFDQIPLPDGMVDIAIFNASLHYATDIDAVIKEAVRTLCRDGRLVVLDSPFYRQEWAGAAMVAEKKAMASRNFGELAETLLALPFVEYLTRQRLGDASKGLGLRWHRHRVLYPIWYELRPLRAALRGDRPPSRFDLWVGERS